MCDDTFKQYSRAARWRFLVLMLAVLLLSACSGDRDDGAGTAPRGADTAEQAVDQSAPGEAGDMVAEGDAGAGTAQASARKEKSPEAASADQPASAGGDEAAVAVDEVVSEQMSAPVEPGPVTAPPADAGDGAAANAAGPAPAQAPALANPSQNFIDGLVARGWRIQRGPNGETLLLPPDQ